ncbi:MAG: hypothetical protein VX282_01875, partial [Candidatus Neomarinimicrobiota bacterium]|nr:hypothetical protein [Candidatus Neomarinimicrobiota bacterium]
MNNVYKLLITVIITTTFGFSQTTYVPDDNFEQALIDLGYDDTLDDYVLTANISGVTSLDVSEKEISDLTGIEGFTALTTLNCDNNELTSLDLTSNSNLTYLYCRENQLVNLDVDNISTLDQLHCHDNQLTSIDLTSNVALTFLTCQNNQLTTLDLSSNTALTLLYCGNNQLTSLNVNSN